jgi:hypothetical protein
MPEVVECDIEAGAVLNVDNKSTTLRRRNSPQSYEKVKEGIKVIGLVIIVLCVLYSVTAGSTTTAEAATKLTKLSSAIAEAALEWRGTNRTMLSQS